MLWKRVKFTKRRVYLSHTYVIPLKLKNLSLLGEICLCLRAQFWTLLVCIVHYVELCKDGCRTYRCRQRIKKTMETTKMRWIPGVSDTASIWTGGYHSIVCSMDHSLGNSLTALAPTNKINIEIRSLGKLLCLQVFIKLCICRSWRFKCIS